MKPTDSEIMRALVNQVMKAAHGDTEQNVVTFITKPMWRAFCRATGLPKDAKPSEWKSVDSVRVFGSKTIVVDSKKIHSASFSISYETRP